MSKVTYFRSPAEEAAVRIARAIRGRGAVSKIARMAEVPERTAQLWIEHPERMRQLISIIAMLHAAEVPEGEIAKMVRGTY